MPACALMKEEIYEQHTDKKAPEAKLFPLHLGHTLIICFMFITSPIMPTFGNAHSQHKIFEIPTNGRGFSLFLFSFFVIFFKCAPGLQAG